MSNKINSFDEIISAIATTLDLAKSITSFSSLIASVPSIIALVEKDYEILSGVLKKQIVVSAVQSFVDQYIPEAEQELANNFISSSLSSLIDEIVSVCNVGFKQIESTVDTEVNNIEADVKLQVKKGTCSLFCCKHPN